MPTPADLDHEEIAAKLEDSTAQETLEWMFENFGERHYIACSFQKTSSVTVDIVSRLVAGRLWLLPGLRLDVVAGAMIGRGLGLLRAGGSWVVAGALDGWAVDLDVRRLYLANLALVGSTMHTPHIFDLLVDFARRGVIRPVISATFALGEVAEAQRQLGRRQHVGKLVVVP